ncbi:MAG: hypothetical protein Q8930_19470 [Bacillota bacterium]|nr:hypothetical protein [Bacillota bacterium]
MENKIDLRRKYNRTLVIDIDSVLAVEDESIPLTDRPVISDALDAIRLLRQKEFKIILYTARFNHQKDETIEWLNKNNIEYDKIIFGKPRALLYIDDRGYRFKDWKSFFEDVEL